MEVVRIRMRSAASSRGSGSDRTSIGSPVSVRSPARRQRLDERVRRDRRAPSTTSPGSRRTSSATRRRSPGSSNVSPGSDRPTDGNCRLRIVDSRSARRVAHARVTGCRGVRRLRRRTVRSRRSPLPLPVHHLHQLRPAVHDRPPAALRPSEHDDGRIPVVRGLRADQYDDPTDRRFHAQPLACSACGPHLTHLAAGRATVGDDTVIAAVQRGLGAGQVIAIKGLGGYHLACNALDGDAVDVLRAAQGTRRQAVRRDGRRRRRSPTCRRTVGRRGRRARLAGTTDRPRPDGRGRGLTAGRPAQSVDRRDAPLHPPAPSAVPPNSRHARYPCRRCW